MKRNRASFRASSLLFVLGLAASSPVTAQTIETYAGGGPNNLPALDVGLDDPVAIALDPAGGYLIVDQIENRVYRVDSASNLTVVVGTGFGGFAGDGGPATQARLNRPAAIAVGTDGDLYIADRDNDRIRRVDAATGTISTFAGNGAATFSGDGGPASSAGLNSPVGVVLDPAGNLFLADRDNHRIRRIDAVTGIITTVAGNGAAAYAGDGGPATLASLRSPDGLFVDPSGNIWIADTSNNVIRKVTAATGLIDTLAGSGLAGFSGDGGPATAAQLRLPRDMAVDAAGNFWIADQLNRRVRYVNVTTGTITTVAGTGGGGFVGDGGPATSASISTPWEVEIDGGGNLTITDRTNHRIRFVDGATSILSTIAGSGAIGFSGEGVPSANAALRFPVGVTLDGSGNLFIADRDTQRVRRVDAATGIIVTVAGQGSAAFAGDGGPATAASLNFPFGVAADAAGSLWIADMSNQRVRRVDPVSGIITTVAGDGVAGFGGDGGAATAAQLRNPSGVALDSTGHLFIADRDNHRVRRVDAVTGIITTVVGIGIPGFSGDGGLAVNARVRNPTDLVLDAAGNLFVADKGNHRVRRVDAVSGLITTYAGSGVAGFTGDGGAATAARLWEPWGVALDSATGDLYIADMLNKRIRVVDAVSGSIDTVAGNGLFGFSGDGGLPTAARLADPFAVVVIGGGSEFFIADSSNDRVRRVTSLPSPIANAGPDQVVECAGNGEAEVTLDGSASSDPGGQSLMYDWSGPFGTINAADPFVMATVPLGVFTIALTVSNPSGGSDSDSVQVTVQDSTAPTIVGVPADVTVEQSDLAGTPVALTAPTATDLCDAAPVVSSDAPTLFPLGTTTVTFTATDASGNASTATTTVTVEPGGGGNPTMSVILTPATLWPPNHRLVEVQATVVTEGFSGTPVIVLDSIASDEADDAPGGGDGRTTGDIREAQPGTPDLTFRLRAERLGSGDGRTYTVTYSASDGTGASASISAVVFVPHDQDGVTEPLMLGVEEAGASGTAIDWEPVETALFYDLIRGDLANLAFDGDVITLGDVVCVASQTATSQEFGERDPEIPPSGQAFFYLVQFNDGQDSSFGTESAIGPRQPATRACE